MTAKDNEKNKGKVIKMTIYFRVYKCVCKFHGSFVFRWMVGVGSWDGRVVDRCSWRFNAGNWRWSSRKNVARWSLRVADVVRVVEVQLDDRCG